MKNNLKYLKSEFSTIFNISCFYKKPHFSQEGEDIIINKYFSHKNNGFYVDVGAHHPFRYSNTYLLYKKGWNGINIDPTPGVKRLFDRTRKRDTNLELAIDKKSGKKVLFIFKDQALNTLSKTFANIIIKSGQSKLLNTISVKTQRLDNILDKYLKKEKQIDLLNIDVEGYEMNVLNSINWAKYRPNVIIIENIYKTDELRKYLSDLNYLLYANTLSSNIYVQK